LESQEEDVESPYFLSLPFFFVFIFLSNLGRITVGEEASMIKSIVMGLDLENQRV